MNTDNSTRKINLMLDEDYKKEIINIIEHTSLKGVCSTFSSRLHKYLKDWIYQKTSYLDNKKYGICHRIYWILNDITEFPKCYVCGKPVTRPCGLHGYDKYPLYCSHLCSARSDDKFRKSKETCLKKYGTEWSFQNEDCKNKSKKTNLEKYGKEYSSQSEAIRNKIIKTCLEKYGKSYITQTDLFKEKSKKTCLEKYGVDNPSKSEIVKNKLKQTCLERFDTKSTFECKNIKNKCYKTMIERYGAKTTLESKELKSKVISTIQDLYNVNTYSKTEKFKKESSINQRSSYYDKHINNNDMVSPLFSKEDYVNCDDIKHTKFLWKCKKCGNEFEYIIDGNWKNLGRCPKCYPRLGGRSKMEQEVYEFVKSILPENTEIVCNTKSVIPPKELDIYIPSKNLAIEFDGLYWHSVDVGTPWNYHLEKTLECESKGIKLIHIFEDEWILKQNIIKSIIKSKLGIFDKTVYARQCEIGSVPNKVVEKFIDENHLQGYKPASINIALFHDDKMVSVMTFGHSRYNKKYQYEMYRFCNLLNTKVTGGASKMYKYFIKRYDPQSIVTYCDRRFSDGKIYRDILGMTQLLTSEPNYFYIYGKDSLIRESRVKYQKHKLSKILESYDPNLTEHQNMANNGYYRIYDCGNLVFGYNKF